MMGYGVYVVARRPATRAAACGGSCSAGCSAARRARRSPRATSPPAWRAHGGRHHGRRARDDPRRDRRSSAPTTSTSCATRAGRGSRSSRTTGTSSASPTAPRSSTPRCTRTARAAGPRRGRRRPTQVRTDTPLESLIGYEPLRTLGALMAVDAEGRLRGVVTLEQVSRALQARLAPVARRRKLLCGPCPHTTC